MASQIEVKRYLAYWFQLGKKVVISNGAVTLLPKEVLKGDRYSDEFEECWRTIVSQNASDCYLEGTHETIAELLSPEWDMSPCARCSMPIPIRDIGMPSLVCPCSDLANWPNTEIPQPRCPIDTNEQLLAIRDRLLQNSSL